MEKDNRYHTGYDPEALEHDLRLISRLMNGKKTLTNRHAQEIYHEIKSKNIVFQSSKGEEFLEKIQKNTTEAQRRTIEQKILAKKRRKHTTRRLLNINRRIAIVMSVSVLLLCVMFVNWNIILDIRTNYQAKKLREKILVSVDSEDTSKPQSDEDVIKREDTEEGNPKLGSQKEPVILSKFSALYEENSDFAGWLSIEGTKINYPVMAREGDNDYYLDKNFSRQEDKNGLLILDYRSDLLADGNNIIIYGHNMRTGVMFGTLDKYKSREFCMEHQTIRFDSLYEEGTYRVVAAMLSAVAYEDEEVFRYYDAIDVSTQESFEEFRQNIESNALYTTDESLTYGDICLILSTCDYYTEDGRFVVIAKKID
ncbi:MAG: class B sortase [Lachnospiraceae bacterium]|nr:class B sortase [Lachnospiraceae bacterium]